MKVSIEITADKNRFYAIINGVEFTSKNTSEASLVKLWLEILKAKVYPGNDEELDIYCAEEYYPEWPLSIADILDIRQKFSRDMYFEAIDW